MPHLALSAKNEVFMSGAGVHTVRSMTPLLTPRLRLRDLEPRDLEAFLGYRADPEVARFQGWSDYTRADAEAFFARQAQATFGVPESWYQVAVADRVEDRLLGDCALHFIDAEQVELGFTLARSAQGQGHMREAAGALLRLLFETLDTHRVVARLDTRNGACLRLLEGLGFRREPHYRQNIFFKGAWGDEFLYALLAEEWAARQPRA